MTDKFAYAYIGRKPCGCVVEIMVDEPEYAKRNAKRVAKLIRDGLSVERTTAEYARENFVICTHDAKPHRKQSR